MALGYGVWAPPAQADVVWCENCSTIDQQMTQVAKEVEIALTSAQQLQTQIQQYQDMVQQGIRLPSRMFNSITGDLNRVKDVYTSTQALGRDLSTLDAKFKSQFPGYDSYLKASGRATDDMPARYEKWSAVGLDSAREAMKAADMSASTLDSEDAMLNQMLSRSQTATGRMQALQAGNEIAALNVQQLQKLRDMVATQTTLQGNYIAAQTERMAIDDAARKKFRSGVVHGTGANKEY